MSEPTIIFSYNWNNKLSGKAFTTIRLKNFRFREEETYEIYLRKGKEGFAFLCHASIVAIRDFTLDDLSEYMALLDTGYYSRECKEIIRNMYSRYHLDWDRQLLSFILLKKSESVKHKSAIETLEFVGEPE